ncbi:serine/threonine protein kinase [Parahaliea maris]|uniref:Serine/threonine protein kinase n=1 Tax=Parahaliea maris TaxID=2716870 RepID=A0A5C8ZZY8_9GAMM|nr:serine/threonine-protein kinase [Parahaliea maris]TXS94173.1 serine/threonine protein kinase [Parahaliea maris]
MSSELWADMERLFHAALELPPGKRAAFLERECGDNRDLLDAVLELLNNSDTPAELDYIVGASARDWLEQSTLEQGDRAGSYRILRKIGQGGMGTVYLASRADDQYEQQVAIKIINQLAGENADVLRRFQDERQILANLQHPNITRLLDGGSLEDGSPFLVMEYVDGERIDRYCTARSLSVDAILRLFVKVCGAVEHAHQNLVIHRDLKPSNIAIDHDGEPKLMDFGVAKLIRSGGTSEDPQTLMDERVLTPLYASPEQLSGEPVSTLSDVYSLGVILYELMTGHRPFDGADSGTWAYARRVIETEPPSLRKQAGRPVDDSAAPAATPSRRRFNRDLDNIVLKALHRDAARRYQSVAALTRDIENYLARRPVSARPPSLPYLIQRFVQRNRLASVLILSSTITVTALGIALWQQAQVLAVERDVARDQLARTTAVLGLVEEMFTGLHPDNSGGKDVTVREMLDLAAVRLDADSAKAESAAAPARAVIQRIIGQTYNELGLIEPARQQLKEALSLHRGGQIRDDEEKLRALLDLSETYYLAFELEARLELANEALAFSEQLYGRGNLKTLEAASAVASSQHMLGELQQSRDRFADIYQRRRELQGATHRQTLGTLQSLGVLEHWLGNYDAALEDYSRCASQAEQTLGPSNTLTMSCLSRRGLVLETMGRYADAVEALEQHLALAEEVLGPNHPETLRSLHSLADAHRGLGQYAAAEPLFLDVLERRRTALGANHIETLQSEMKLARLYRLMGRYTEARPLIEHAVAEEVRQQGFAHPATLIAAQEQAELLLALDDLGPAEPLLKRILAAREEVLGSNHPELQRTLTGLARIDLARDKPLAARHYLERALALVEPHADYQRQEKEAVLTLLIASSEALQDSAASRRYRQQLASFSEDNR